MACDTNYPCLHCGQQHSNPGALARHKAKHVPPGGFACSICKAPFTTVEARQMHKRQAHVVYRCRICKVRFSMEQEYRDHIENMHDGILKKPHEICDTCGSQFPTKTQLRHHAESNCGTEKRFECEICKRSYKTDASLRNHKRSHQIGKTELCGFCGASFLNRGQLKIHERVHTGEKPYKCDKCDKAFGYRESLITHSTIHSGIKPFFCKCCDARFSCVGNLIKHRKLRPQTCGLPEYNATNRVTPRLTKKTMPSLTDRKKSRTLVDPLEQRLENGSDTRTVSSELTSESKCVELLEVRTSELSSNYSLHDDEGVLSEEYYNLDNESEELIDEVIIHDEEDDKRVLPEYIDLDEGQPNEDIFEEKSHEQTSDNAQENDTKEKYLLFKNEKGETRCSQDDEVNCEKQPYLVDRSITDEPREHVQILKIQIIQDGEQSTDEESERYETTSLLSLKTTGGLGEDDDTCVIEKDVVEHEHESKSEQKETISSEEVCVKPNKSSIVSVEIQGSPETSIPYSEIENKDRDLQTQLEIVRTNSEVSTNMFACKLCPLQYTTAYLMARHLERMHNFQLGKAREKLKFAKETVREKRFRCKYCNLSYVNASRLKSHIGKHGADGRLMHKCPACARYFETEEMARRHALEQHRTRLVCGTCEKEFKEPESLQQHVRYAHKGMKELRRQRYMCHRCGKYFITRNSMSDHERANCGQSPIHRCETCGKHYASFGSLKVHQTMHQNLLPYECEYCRKRFRVKGQLKVHERSHTGEKPFRCEHCPKSFPYRESLLVHQVSHTGVKRFACSGCAQTFTCISNLQAHRRYHRATCGAVPNNTKPIQHEKE